MPTDAVRLKPARRPAYITATRQRAVWRCGRGVRPLPAFRPRILPHPPGPRAESDAAARGTEGPTPVTTAPATPARATKDAEILLGTLHNYRNTASLGLDVSNMIATSVVVDTGAGASVIRPEALPGGWDAAITPHPPGAGIRLRDVNRNQLVNSGTLSLLFWAGGLCVPCTFQVVASLSVPVLLGCDFLDAHAHAILPSDQAVRWHDGTASAIFRGPNDSIDRRASASRVLRLSYKTQLAPRSATFSWVRTRWGGLGQMFGASRLMFMYRATVINEVQEILPDIAFPVVISNFGDCEVTLRPTTAICRVEVLNTGVIALPARPSAGGGGPMRVDVPARDPSFCGSRPADEGSPAVPLPTAAVHGDLLMAELPEGAGGPEGDPPEEAPEPAAPSPSRVSDVPLPEAPPHLHDRIRAMLRRHEAMWSGQALDALKATMHHNELTPGAKPVRVPPRRAGPKAREAEAAVVESQLVADVIEPTSSEWGFPVVLVFKKNGTLRFFMDHRLLNAVSKRDSYPLPRMDECIDSLGEAKVFSTLDCNARY